MNQIDTYNLQSDKKLAAICIDDDPFVLQMLEIQFREIFINEELLLELIPDSRKAIQQINYLIGKGYEIAFLITDYCMPHISGYELVYAVKTKYPALQFIMLSGQADKFEVRELLETQLISSFINKPWKLSDLQIALNRISTLNCKI
jgi:DNA-binding NtrC family response regulator